jgi:hypothetical protein
MRALALALLLGLAACAPQVKYITRTETVEVPVITVMRVAPELTAQHPIAEGGLADCPVVAAQRKDELQSCNGKLEAIEARHGERSE